MSIRIRASSGSLTVALCAAETDPQPGDVYLDDNQHNALAAKFADDWQGQTVLWQYPDEWAEMERHKLRDAGEELNKWLASADTRPEGGDATEIAASFTSGAIPNEDSGDAQ